MQAEQVNAMRRTSIPASVLFPPVTVMLTEKPTVKEIAPGQ